MVYNAYFLKKSDAMIKRKIRLTSINPIKVIGLSIILELISFIITSIKSTINPNNLRLTEVCFLKKGK